MRTMSMPSRFFMDLEHHLGGAVAVAVFELAGVGAGVAYELADRPERACRIDGDHRAENADLGERGEIPDRIVGHVLEQARRRRMGGVGGDHQSVAVGCARATASAATTPPPPVLFSITTGWPSASCRYCPIRRANRVGLLPAV